MTAADIARARILLAGYFSETPVIQSAALSTGKRSVFLKNETVLPTGSFKARGALYALSARVDRGAVSEVVAASTGNHGAAVAYAARVLGARARIFVPERSNPVKTQKIRESGAALVESGRDLSAAIDAAAEYATRTGAFFLHDASDPDIPVGTATIGSELLEQVPSIDAVYIPMGDTALVRGVASALRLGGSAARVVGVVSEGAPAYRRSWLAGAVVETDAVQTIADGLAVRRPLAPNVAAIRELMHDVVAVSDAELISAIVRLRDGDGILVEPSGAAAVAALVTDPDGRGNCAALLTGRNLSPEIEALL
jgi:threonine dehydratase